MAEVVVDGKMLVVHPDRSPVEWNPVETLSVARYVAQFRIDVGTDTGDVDATVVAFQRGGIEERHPGDMHVAGLGLERQE